MAAIVDGGVCCRGGRAGLRSGWFISIIESVIHRMLRAILHLQNAISRTKHSTGTYPRKERT